MTKQWKKSESTSFDLELKTERWRVTIRGFAATKYVTVDLWLVRRNDEYGEMHVCDERPIAWWSNVHFDNEEDLRRSAERLASDFIDTLISGWSST